MVYRLIQNNPRILMTTFMKWDETIFSVFGIRLEKDHSIVHKSCPISHYFIPQKPLSKNSLSWCLYFSTFLYTTTWSSIHIFCILLLSSLFLSTKFDFSNCPRQKIRLQSSQFTVNSKYLFEQAKWGFFKPSFAVNCLLSSSCF